MPEHAFAGEQPAADVANDAAEASGQDAQLPRPGSFEPDGQASAPIMEPRPA